MVSQRAEPSRWRQNEMDTAASRTVLFLAHTAKQTKQTASQDLTEKTAGSDRFHLICWHL